MTGSDVMFLGSDELHNADEPKTNWTKSDYVYQFDNSLTFADVTALKTYYVYIFSYRKADYEICLTYSYLDHKH